MRDEELGETSLITREGRTVFGGMVWLLGHDVIPTRQMLKAAEQRHFSVQRVVILFPVTSKGRIILFRD